MVRNREGIRQTALAYLESHRVMTLSTIGGQGPWAAAVFYASQGFDLYFLSAEQTRHIQNLMMNPHAAATIQEEYEDWPDIKGIQLEGIVRKLSGTDRREAMALYQGKYPFIVSAGAQIQTALNRVSWFKLKPDRLYFIDNSLGFGHRDEVDLSRDA